MKKVTGILIFIIVLAFASMGFAADQSIKMAYVDLSRLFDEYYKTKDYDKVLEGKTSEFEKDRNVKVEKIRDAQGKLGLLADDKKKDQEAEIEKLKADLLEFDRQKKADLTKERNEKIREILLEIEKEVSVYAEKEKYSVILNDRVLIYGNPAMNVTEPILTKLNEGHPVEKTDKKSPAGK